MKKTRSRIRVLMFLWLLVMLACTALLLWLFFRLLLLIPQGISGSALISVVILVFVIAGVLTVVGQFKYITIGNGRMKTYSILHPWGKTVDLTRCRGILTGRETGVWGSFPTVHFVDQDGYTGNKIHGAFYRNFDQLVAATGLREVGGYEFTTGKLIKLLFTGRIKL
ncbi:MAG: hypothetical protein LUF87_01745 [Alistipes sp.]|nr:hypothetical protein [Alistipes sp.]